MAACGPEGPEKGGVSGIQLEGMARHLVLERLWWFWITPVIGSGAYRASGKAVPDEAQFYSVLMKLVSRIFVCCHCALVIGVHPYVVKKTDSP